MIDIIERLRSFPENVLEGSSLCIESADEIEKLRGEVADLAHQLNESNERNGRLIAERDAAVKALRFLFDHGAYLTERVPDDLKAAIDAARGEK